MEAVTYRYRGHSMADPEEYRSKEEVEEWREKDPIKAFSDRLIDEGVVSEDDVKEFDEKAIEVVDEAVKFADGSPFPDLDSLYDDIYVFNEDEEVPAWWTVDERSPEPHRGEREREAGDVPHELAEKGAAYANVGDRKSRKSGSPQDQDQEGSQQGPGAEEEDDADAEAEAGAEASGDGEPEADDRDTEGGGG